MAFNDFCANENEVKVILKGLCFIGIWLQEYSSEFLLIQSGFLRVLWLW